MIIVHVPRSISAPCYFFLSKRGTILCQITGNKHYFIDMPQGGLELPCTLTFIGPTLYVEKTRKLIDQAPSKNMESPTKRKG